MSGIDSKLREISKLNTLQQRDQWMNNIHPLVKLLLSFTYIFFIISVDKYNLSRMLSFAVYPFIAFEIADLRMTDAIYRMRLILPLVMAVGIFNPFMDESVIYYAGIAVNAGVISMLTLMLKGIYSVLAAYILIATTSIEEISYALRLLKVPQMMVTVIMLIDRYIYILGEEASHIMTAYRLRAPSQRGIAYRAWGPLVGQWLIRSMDRAESVYESMQLRGFRGEYRYARRDEPIAGSIIFLALWIIVFIILRFTNIIDVIGGIFV